MQLTINKGQLQSTPDQFLRKAGYTFIFDRKTRKESFVMRLSGGHYPRLHMYVQGNNEHIIFNLHLDQKKPSYAGQSAHSAEYDGEIVENEISRLNSLVNAQQQIVDNVENVELKKKGFFSKVFSIFK